MDSPSARLAEPLFFLGGYVSHADQEKDDASYLRRSQARVMPGLRSVEIETAAHLDRRSYPQTRSVNPG